MSSERPQKRPRSKLRSIRLTSQDETNVARIIRSGWAINRTDAIRHALQFTAEKVAA